MDNNTLILDDNIMITESFYTPFTFKNNFKADTPFVSKYSKQGINEAKKYFDSIRSPESIKTFLRYGYHDVRRRMNIQYGLEIEDEGSSRIVFKSSNNTVLKVASDGRGVAQNRAESHDKHIKNAYGCFPYILWNSHNYLAIECEYTEFLGGSELEFEEITGIPFSKFDDYISFLNFIQSTGVKRYTTLIPRVRNADDLEEIKENAEEVANLLNTSEHKTAKTVLKNLAHYILNHNNEREFIGMDLNTAGNWGKTIRNGELVCVPLDTGGTSFVLNTLYNGDWNGD